MKAQRPTAAEIKARREETGEGLHQCRATMLHEYRLVRLKEIRQQSGELYTVDACRDVIVELLDLILEVENEDD